MLCVHPLTSPIRSKDRIRDRKNTNEVFLKATVLSGVWWCWIGGHLHGPLSMYLYCDVILNQMRFPIPQIYYCLVALYPPQRYIWDV